MLQKPVFALPGCQRMRVNTLLCDTLRLADVWAKERLVGDLRQSVPQNGRVHLLGVDTFRGPKTHPKSRNTKKTPRSHELLRKVRANFSLLSCDTSQEPGGNCSDKLVQMNFFILGGFFRVDFPPVQTFIYPVCLGQDKRRRLPHVFRCLGSQNAFGKKICLILQVRPRPIFVIGVSS